MLPERFLSGAAGCLVLVGAPPLHPSTPGVSLRAALRNGLLARCGAGLIAPSLVPLHPAGLANDTDGRLAALEEG